MNLDLSALKSWRLASQKLLPQHALPPSQAVEWLGGVQAQDYRWAKWSIGLRIGDASDFQVEQALHNRQIVRTWLFRGTLHFVAARHLGWLTALLAPGIIRGNSRRYRQLQLDEAAFARSQAVLQRAVEARGPLTRQQIKALFEQHGIPAQGQQLPYLLQRAALDGLICHGPLSGSEPTFALISDWIGAQLSLAREEALSRLASLYFASHGPAQLQDFSWWSGLGALDARQALDSAPELVSLDINGVRCWAAGSPPPGAALQRACLLPPFDEYLLGYRDRSQVLNPAHARQVNAGGGMPRSTLLLNGEIAGVWSSQARKQKLLVTIQPFRELESQERDLIALAAAQLGNFQDVPVGILF